LLFQTFRENPPPELVPKQFFKPNLSKILSQKIICKGPKKPALPIEDCEMEEATPISVDPETIIHTLNDKEETEDINILRRVKKDKIGGQVNNNDSKNDCEDESLTDGTQEIEKIVNNTNNNLAECSCHESKKLAELAACSSLNYQNVTSRIADEIDLIWYHCRASVTGMTAY
jgi:hypothetical protein